MPLWKDIPIVTRSFTLCERDTATGHFAQVHAVSCYWKFILLYARFVISSSITGRHDDTGLFSNGLCDFFLSSSFLSSSCTGRATRVSGMFTYAAVAVLCGLAHMHDCKRNGIPACKECRWGIHRLAHYEFRWQDYDLHSVHGVGLESVCGVLSLPGAGRGYCKKINVRAFSLNFIIATPTICKFVPVMLYTVTVCI